MAPMLAGESPLTHGSYLWQRLRDDETWQNRPTSEASNRKKTTCVCYPALVSSRSEKNDLSADPELSNIFPVGGQESPRSPRTAHGAPSSVNFGQLRLEWFWNKCRVISTRRPANFVQK